MKFEITPCYKSLESFVRVLAVPLFFARNGEVLHEGRNMLKLFEVDGQRVVVKRYGRLSFFNRLVYGVLRKSKAERAYRHAMRLHKLGIDTPEELGFVEIRRWDCCGIVISCRLTRTIYHTDFGRVYVLTRSVADVVVA